MKVSRLAAKGTRQAAVDFGDGDVLNVTYTPNRLILADTLPTEDLGEIVGRVCRLITSWDLVDDAGAMIPLTPESVQEVPALVLARVMEVIGQDQQPGELTGSK